MDNQLKSKQLLQSFNMHDLTLPNRVVMAPMTRSRAGENRIPNALMAEYYSQRASAGLIITEATTISPQANGWNQSPGIYTDEMVDGWKLVTDAVHAQGGRVFLQLWHMGRASHSDFHDGDLPVAPSAVAISGDGIHTPDGQKSSMRFRELWKPTRFQRSLRTIAKRRSVRLRQDSTASKSIRPTAICLTSFCNQKPTTERTSTAAALKTDTAFLEKWSTR